MKELLIIWKKDNNIKNEINISYSSLKSNDPWNVFNYDGKKHQFFTEFNKNSWFCIEFKNYKIKPTNYTIRSGCDSDNPKSFVLEGSNDKKEWKILDEQKEIDYLKGELSFHTFTIQQTKRQAFKYFRIRITGKNWSNQSRLQFNSIEFFGEIF